MSIKIMSAVWDTKVDTHTMKLVLLSLADQSNDQGVTWPSIDTIAERCDLTRQSVITQIEKLKAAGFLKVETRGGRRSNCYTVAVNGVDYETQKMQSTASSVAVNGINPVVNGINVAVNGVDPIRKEPSVEPKKKPKSVRVFVKPEMHEVEAFAQELGFPASDGTAFFWGKEGNGWRNGERPVVCWRATFRNWAANGWLASQKQRPAPGRAAVAADDPRVIESERMRLHYEALHAAERAEQEGRML